MIQHLASFAKINLFLYVTGRRPDGYHDLYSLMTKIDLCDDIRIDFSSKDIQVTCDHPDVPDGESNLVHKAAQLFFQSVFDLKRKSAGGVSISIKKNIPPGGGLGGGSSNAASALMALNVHYKNLFSRTKLLEMGLSLGADVPFFIHGGPALATGVGERLDKVQNLKPYYLLLCDPGVAASTADVYKNIDFSLTSKPKYNMNTGLNVPLRGQEFDVRGQLHNDLMEPACRLYPEIKETKEAMELVLRKKVFMTGSGATLFVLFSSRENAKKSFEKLLDKWRGTKRKIFLSAFN